MKDVDEVLREAGVTQDDLDGMTDGRLAACVSSCECRGCRLLKSITALADDVIDEISSLPEGARHAMRQGKRILQGLPVEEYEARS